MNTGGTDGCTSTQSEVQGEESRGGRTGYYIPFLDMWKVHRDLHLWRAAKFAG